MLLREGGENEVRLRNREESTVCLRAFPAPEAPRTHGDLGLLNLVPRALGIQFGVDEAGQTLFLICLEHVDPGREEYGPDGDGRQQSHGHSLLPLQTAQKY